MRTPNNNSKLSRITGLLFIVMTIACVMTLFAGCGNDDKDVKKGKKLSDNNLYIADNKARYDAYKKENPNLSDGDVVWMVNVDLDKGLYENVNTVQNPSSLSALVNKHNALPDDFEPKELKDIGGKDRKLIPEAADEFLQMLDDAQKVGYEMIPQSGYRTYSDQEMTYEGNKELDPENVDTFNARPRYSEHETGLAADLNLPAGGSLHNFTDTEESAWVSANAYKYGFIVRYTEENQDITGYIPEPWHIRYVGKDIAKTMKEKNIESYEEYVAKYLMD